MRRVGEELGTGVGSLYWHVRNKDELFQLIFERVTGQMVLPEPDPSHWKEQLRQLAHEMRAILRATAMWRSYLSDASRWDPSWPCTASGFSRF